VTLDRPDMAARAAENWRPPLFIPPSQSRFRIVTPLRRFFDLQAGSIWRDLSRLLPHASGAVLDAGCGAQPYRGLFRRDVRYIGIDTEDARRNFGYETPDTRYFRGDTWPVEDASIDLVLCTEALEHVPDPARLLSEAMRSLRPGGTLVLTVPFAARWHFIPHDYWRFTPSGLKRLLSECGFTVTGVYARGNAFTVACYKAMALILRLAMPQNATVLAKAPLVLLSLPLLPALFILAAAANLSLRGGGGDDCLGYTALAQKRAA
jgi:SAM-dependent methyltransferase